MNTIIIAIFTIMFFLPGLLLILISAVLLNIGIAYTGTDYFDCWLIRQDYCYKEGGVYHIPEPPIQPSEGYREAD